mmetsp:Transcript_109072/g.348206  ORF Transcript_109072/g.348206 Transcript_109072/m.348206 type:complete len:411 (+) Transcript_109072:2-1234(+)
MAPLRPDASACGEQPPSTAGAMAAMPEDVSDALWVLDAYHECLKVDTGASARRAASARRQGLLAHNGGGGGYRELGACTWATLEESVESQVSLLRGLCGARSIWSPGLCERLRARCTAQGTWSLVNRQAAPPCDEPEPAGSAFWGALGSGTAFVGEGALEPEALGPLVGQAVGKAAGQERRRAHIWAYHFEDPAVAAAHLAAHPAFSAALFRTGPSAAAPPPRAGLAVVVAEGGVATWVGGSSSTRSGSCRSAGRRGGSGLQGLPASPRRGAPRAAAGLGRLALVVSVWQPVAGAEVMDDIVSNKHQSPGELQVVLPPLGPDMAALVDACLGIGLGPSPDLAGGGAAGGDGGAGEAAAVRAAAERLNSAAAAVASAGAGEELLEAALRGFLATAGMVWRGGGVGGGGVSS